MNCSKNTNHSILQNRGITERFHRLYAGFGRVESFGGICRDRLPSQSYLGAGRAFRGKPFLCVVRIFDYQYPDDAMATERNDSSERFLVSSHTAVNSCTFCDADGRDVLDCCFLIRNAWPL